MLRNGYWLGCLALLLLLSACGPKADNRAVLLYEQALPHAHAMLAADDYSAAFGEYSEAAGPIEELLAEHAGLTSNIVGITLDDFIALGVQLRMLAAAEQDILPCATALAMSNDTKRERGSYFITLARAQAAAGNIEETTNLLAMAIVAAETKTNQFSKAHDYTNIAKIYDEVGAKEPANLAAATAERLAVSPSEGSAGGTISRAYSLSQAAMRHLAAGNQERGLELMRLSVDLLNVAQSENKYSMPLSSLADDFDEEGYFGCAMEILKGTNRKNDYLSYVVRDMAERNRTLDRLTQLAEFAMTIQDKYDRDRTLSTLAAHYAAIGHFTSAQMLLSSMESKFIGNDKLWFQTVSNYATNQQINAAFKTSGLIHEGDKRAEALLAIATALADQGHRQYAANTMASALNIALSQSFRPDYEVIGKVATTYAKLGYPEQSQELLEYHAAEARALKRPWSRANALNDLASSLIELDQINEATELLLIARASLANDPKSGLKFKHIAKNLAHAEQYQEALNTAEMIEADSKYKEGTYADLALLFGSADKNELVEQCIEKVVDEDEKESLMEDLVELSLKQGQPERALALADRMKKDNDRCDALALTAVYYAERDEFSHAFETTRLITNVSSQVSALIDIASGITAPRSLCTEEIEALSIIVADHYPMDEFWSERGVIGREQTRTSEQ